MIRNFEQNLDWYRKTYNNLINTRKGRGLDKTALEGYYELHHIIPKCLGGLDEESNCVLLNTKEHLLAHMILARIYYNKPRVVNASIAMCMKSSMTKERDTEKISLGTLSYIRELYGLSQRGKYLDKTHRVNISKAKKGVPNTITWGDNISKAKKGKRYGTAVKGPDGKIYRTLKLAADEYNVVPETIKYWATNIPGRGFSLVDPVEENLKPVERTYTKVQGPDGKIYPSLISCAREYNIDRSTLRNWIKNHPEKGYKYYQD